MPRATRSKTATARASPLKKIDGNVIKKKPAAKSTAKPAVKNKKATIPKKKSAPVAEQTVEISSESESEPEDLEEESDHLEDAGTAARRAAAAKHPNNNDILNPKPKSKSKPTKRPQGRKNLGPNYLFFCGLVGTSDPAITRFLCVPPDLTFAQMHEVLQITFGWANYHHYMFSVEQEPDEKKGGYPELLFYIQDEPYQEIDGNEPAQQWILADVFDNEKYSEGLRVVYEYDMGDSWEHDIMLVGREVPGMRRAMDIPEELDIVCLGGEGHPCAEDSGSITGWEDLKEAFCKTLTPAQKRQRDSKEDAHTRQWYKKDCVNGDKKGLENPYRWNVLEVNWALHEYKKKISK